MRGGIFGALLVKTDASHFTRSQPNDGECRLTGFAALRNRMWPIPLSPMPSRHIPVAALLLAGAACASTPASSSSTAGTSATSPSPSSGPLRWTGNLQATQQRTGDLAPTRQQKATGTVSLTVSPQNPNRTVARITLNSQVQEAGSFPWAVLPGRCGSAALPLVGVEQFPQLEISSNGRGDLTAEVPMTLPSSGNLHVNVYWRGQQLTEVMTCANLKKEGGS